MKPERLSAGLLALVAWATIVLQIYVTVADAAEGRLLFDMVNLFSYFTILSNALIAVTMTCAARRSGGFSHSASFRGALALYIIIVALVFHIVLAPTMTFEGLRIYTNIGFHTVIPAWYVIDWIFFAEGKSLRFADTLKWLLFPLLYCVYSMLRGEAAGWYPYFFLDPNQSSYASVATNITGLVALFLVIGQAVMFLGRKLPWPRR